MAVILRPNSLGPSLHSIPLSPHHKKSQFTEWRKFLGDFILFWSHTKLFVCGGFIPAVQSSGEILSCGEGGVLTMWSPMKIPRQQASLTGFGPYLIASGGLNNNGDNLTVERFSTSVNSWKFLPNLEKKRLAHASTVLSGSFLFLIEKTEISMLNIAIPSSHYSTHTLAATCMVAAK